MCDFLQSFIDSGKQEARLEDIAEMFSNGATESEAKKYLKVTDEELQKAKEMCATTV